jgi:hypothetical protein
MLEDETISKKEATRQVRSMITRTALLYHAFSQSLVDELGEKEGKALIGKAIRRYGEIIGKKAMERALKKDLPLTRENFQDDLPPLGWQNSEMVEVEGEKRVRVHTCYLAEAWKEWGVQELGRLYCFVDQAKYGSFNEELECVHISNLLDGDPFCEIVIRKRKGRRKQGGNP